MIISFYRCELPNETKVGGNRIGRREHSFLSISLKPQIFILPKLGRMGDNEIKFNEFLTKTSKIPIYIQQFILK